MCFVIMKIVMPRQEGSHTLWNIKFQEFAKDMGSVPKLCKPRRPQTKEKVECLVHYVKDNFLPGRTFTDINDLNLQALCWRKKVVACLRWQSVAYAFPSDYLIFCPCFGITVMRVDELNTHNGQYIYRCFASCS